MTVNPVLSDEQMAKMVSQLGPDPEEMFAAAGPDPEEMVTHLTPTAEEMLATIGPDPEEIVAQLTPTPEKMLATVGPDPEEMVAHLTPTPEEMFATIGSTPEELVVQLTPSPEELFAGIGPVPERIVAQLTPSPEELFTAVGPNPEGFGTQLRLDHTEMFSPALLSPSQMLNQNPEFASIVASMAEASVPIQNKPLSTETSGYPSKTPTSPSDPLWLSKKSTAILFRFSLLVFRDTTDLTRNIPEAKGKAVELLIENGEVRARVSLWVALMYAADTGMTQVLPILNLAVFLYGIPQFLIDLLGLNE